MTHEVPAPNLESALARMSWKEEAGSFALIGFPEAPLPADWSALAPPAQLVREPEETSLLVREEELGALLERHPRARVESDLIWIRFEAAMGWEVVGFLARVTGELARAGIPLGAICGYSRDHLFLAARHLPEARRVLARIFPRD